MMAAQRNKMTWTVPIVQNVQMQMRSLKMWVVVLSGQLLMATATLLQVHMQGRPCSKPPVKRVPCDLHQQVQLNLRQHQCFQLQQETV